MLHVVAAYLVLFAVGTGFPQRFDTELHAKCLEEKESARYRAEPTQKDSFGPTP